MKLIPTLLVTTFAFTAATAFAAPTTPPAEEKVIVSTQELPDEAGTTETPTEQPSPTETDASASAEVDRSSHK